MNIHNASDSGGGSLRELLSRNVGQYAAASFLVGSCRLVRQEGVLEEVGTDYLVLLPQSHPEFETFYEAIRRYVPEIETKPYRPLTCDQNGHHHDQ